MSSSNQIESIIQDAFEDMALLIGAVAAVNHIDDAATWLMMRRLHRLRLRTLSRLPAILGRGHSEPATEMPTRPHPAVENFLHLNRGVRMRSDSRERTEPAEAEESLDAGLFNSGRSEP